MSEQPNPTTGEWTADRIVKFLGLHSKHTEACSFLADAINAALAGEREQWRRWKQTAENYAAEIQTLVACLKEFENEYPHVTRVLAEIGGKP